MSDTRRAMHIRKLAWAIEEHGGDVEAIYDEWLEEALEPPVADMVRRGVEEWPGGHLVRVPRWYRPRSEP